MRFEIRPRATYQDWQRRPHWWEENTRMVGDSKSLELINNGNLEKIKIQLLKITETSIQKKRLENVYHSVEQGKYTSVRVEYGDSWSWRHHCSLADKTPNFTAALLPALLDGGGIGRSALPESRVVLSTLREANADQFPSLEGGCCHGNVNAASLRAEFHNMVKEWHIWEGTRDQKGQMRQQTTVRMQRIKVQTWSY